MVGCESEWDGKLARVENGKASIRFGRRLFGEGDGHRIRSAIELLNKRGKRSKSWSQTTLADRIAIVKRFAEQIQSQRSELNRWITSETGKPLWESDTETAL